MAVIEWHYYPRKDASPVVLCIGGLESMIGMKSLIYRDTYTSKIDLDAYKCLGSIFLGLSQTLDPFFHSQYSLCYGGQALFYGIQLHSDGCWVPWGAKNDDATATKSFRSLSGHGDDELVERPRDRTRIVIASGARPRRIHRLLVFPQSTYVYARA
jgi:hypothetical protein